MHEKILTIIPSVDHDEVIPNKNQRLILNRPLIAWTINASKNCSLLDTIIVNTSSTEMADIVKTFHVDVPFLSEQKDTIGECGMLPMILNTLEYFELKKYIFDYVLVLSDHAPLLTPQDIEQSIEMLEEDNTEAVVSVNECVTHPTEYFNIDNENTIFDFPFKKQNDKKLYYINNMIHICKVETIKAQKTLYPTQTTKAFPMNIYPSTIKEELDLYLAEKILDLRFS